MRRDKRGCAARALRSSFVQSPAADEPRALEALEARVLLASAPEGAAFLVNTHVGGEPRDVAAAADSSGRFVLAWASAGQDGAGAGIFAQRYAADGQKLGAEFRANTTTQGDQTAPVVAAEPSGNFVIVWQSAGQDGSGLGIYAQRYDAAGAPVGGEFQVNSFTIGDQADPTIAADASGNFTVAWTSSGQDGSGSGVYAQRFSADGSKLGGEFLVNTVTVGAQHSPSAAMSATGGLVIAWQSDASTATPIVFAQRWDAGGVRQGSEFRVNSSALSGPAALRPAAALSPAGDLGITWQARNLDGSGYGIYAQRYSPAGVKRGAETRVNTLTGGDQKNPAVASDAAGNFAVAWDSPSPAGSSAAVFVQRFGPDGARNGGEWIATAATTGAHSNAALAVSSAGDFVAAWQGPGADGSRAIHAQRFDTFDNPAAVGNVVWNDADKDGLQDSAESGVSGVTVRLYSADAARLLASTTTSASGTYRFDSLRPGDAYFLEFIAPANLTFTALDQGADDSIDSDAHPLTGRTAPFTAASGTVNLRLDAGLSTPASISGTIFNDRDGDQVRGIGEGGLAGRVVFADLDGDAVLDPGEKSATSGAGGLYTISGLVPVTYTLGLVPLAPWEQTTPASALTLDIGPGQALTGIDVGSRNPTRELVTETLGGETLVNTYVINDQSRPQVAADRHGNYVVVWHSLEQDGDAFGIYAQRYDVDGQRIGGEFRVNTTTAAQQIYPHVGMSPSGDFVVAWSSGTSGALLDADVYARRYNAAGEPQGPEFPVNHQTAGGQSVSSVSLGPDGQFIIGWHDVPPEDTNGIGDVYARRYDSSGTPLGPGFRVNNYTNGDQHSVEFVFDASGGYIAVWTSWHQDGDQTGVVAQRFDASGSRLGDEFVVNETTAGQQWVGGITADAAGNFIIAWDQHDVTANNEVFARRFRADGTPLSGEFRVNTATAGLQMISDIAADAQGNFLVTYESPDVEFSGIFGQWFDAAGNRAGPEFRVSTFTSRSQTQPVAAMSPNGHAVVVWQSMLQDRPDGQGVYMQRYSAFTDAASVGGRVWTDADGDSLRDPAEAPVSGRTVTLFQGAGQQVASTVTAQDGTYRFNNLRPGEGYYLVFGPPAGNFYVVADRGADGNDSDVTDRITGRTATFSLAPRQSDLTQWAGLWLPGRIAGSLYNDTDADGIRDAGEAALQGFVVYIDADGDGQPDASERSAVSAFDGSFSFAGLDPAQAYKLALTSQDHWTPTTATAAVTPPPGGEALVGLGVYTDVPDSAVSRLGGRFHANIHTAGGQSLSDVAADADGDHVLVWASRDQDGSGYGVYAQRYNAAGIKQGQEFLVNATTADNQSRPSVAMDEDGDFVVAWVQYGPIATSYRAYARRFDKSGAPLTGEILVADNVVASRGDPAVASDASGAFVVAYPLAVTGGHAVSVSRYSAAGALLGSTQVSTQTGTGAPRTGPYWPSVAADADGDFAVTWQQYASAGPEDAEIFARRYSGTGQPLGSEFRVNSTLDGVQRQPSAALAPDGDLLVTWYRSTPAANGFGILARRYNEAGVPQGEEFRVNTSVPGSHFRPEAAADAAGNFVIAWENTGKANFRRFNRAGVPQGSDVDASTVPGAQPAPGPDAPTGISVAASGGGNVLVTWQQHEGLGLGTGVFGQRYSPHAPGQQVPTASVGGGVWEDTDADGLRDAAELGRAGVLVSLLNAGGELVAVAATDSGGNYRIDGIPIPSDAGDSFTLLFPLPAGESFTTRDQGTDELIDSDADPVAGSTAPFTLTAGQIDLGRSAGLLRAGSISGVVFEDRDSDSLRDLGEPPLDNWGVYLDNNANGELDPGEPSVTTDAQGRFSFSGLRPGTHRVAVLPVTDWSPVNTPASVAVGSGQATTGVNLAVHSNSKSLPAESGPEIAYGTPGVPRSVADIAADADGDFVVTWVSQGNVYAHLFSKTGASRGAPILVNTSGVANRNDPVAAMDADGDFVIAWEGMGFTQEGDGNQLEGIYARKFSASGQPLGAEFHVNQYVFNRQEQPQVAMDADGDFLIVWQSEEQDGGTRGVYARRYNAAAVPQGNEFRVNTHSPNEQSFPAVAMLPDGNAVITWTSHSQDGDSGGIYAQRFDAAGARVGEEFRINAVTTGDQTEPAVAIAPDGSSVFAWRLPQGTAAGIYARRFDPAGQPLGAEFRALESGAYANVVVDPFGGFVVAADRAQIFDAAGRRVGQPLLMTGPEIAADAQGNFLSVSFTVRRFERFAETPASVGGFLWTDIDGDGIKDPEDSPRGGFVELLTPEGTVIGSASTDAEGAYRFDVVRPNVGHVLRFRNDNQLLFTRPDQGADDALDSDVVSTAPTGNPGLLTGDTALFTLAPGQLDLTRSAGQRRPATLSGSVFHDADGDGLRDGGELPVNGIRVFIDQDADGRLDDGEPTAFTDTGDLYSFAGLFPGTYRIALAPNDYWSTTSPAFFAQGTLAENQRLDGLDLPVRTSPRPLILAEKVGGEVRVNEYTNARQNNPSIAYDAAGNSVVAWYSDHSSPQAWGIHARRYGPDGAPLGPIIQVSVTNAISDRAPAVAMNDDGEFVVAWQGLDDLINNSSGIRARRFSPSGAPRGGEIIVNTNIPGEQANPSVIIDAQGDFVVSWSEAPPSAGAVYPTYIRRFNSNASPKGAPQLVAEIPSQFIDRTTTLVSDAAGNFAIGFAGLVQLYNANGTPRGGAIRIGSGTALPTRIAMGRDGRFVASSDRLILHFDADGVLQGGVKRPTAAEFTLGIEPDGGFAVASAAADLRIQRYDAAGLSRGRVLISDVPPTPGWEGTEADPVIAFGPGGRMAVVWTHLYHNTDHDVFLQRYALYPQPGAAVAGAVWIDTDADGRREDAEPGRDGVTVTLYHSAGGVAATTTTAAGGQYQFTGLLPGAQYQVGFSLPGEHILSPAGVGAEDSDSDADPQTSRTALFTAPAEGMTSRQDAGIYGFGSVGGFKFHDLDGNGVRSPNEPGLSGWTVFLDADSDGQLDATERSTVTGTNGGFSFGQLTPGTYRVADVAQTLWTSTTGVAQDVPLVAGQTLTTTLLGARSAIPVVVSIPTGPEFRVNATAQNYQIYPSAAVDAAGNWVVVWHSERTGGRDVYMQRYDAAGALAGTETRVNAQASDAHGNAKVARSASGAFVVVWSTIRPATGGGEIHEIRARRFDAAGVAQGTELIVATASTPFTLPRVAISPTGAFVVVWHDSTATQQGTFARRYDAAGQPLGDKFFAMPAQRPTAVAMDAFGRFLISGDAGVQRFDADGLRLGAVIPAPGHGRLAMDGQGNFVVVGGTAFPGAPSLSARRYDADGNPQGAAFTVNTTSPDTLHEPEIVMDPAGSFLITWQSASGGDSRGDIYAQRFTATGLKAGPEVIVNTYRDGRQHAPAVAMDPDGDVLIAWTSLYQDGSLGGIYAQRYRANTYPATTGLPGVAVDEDAPDTVIDLFAAFSDANHADSALTYSVTGGAGLVTSAAVSPATGKLTLKYAPNTSGAAVLTVTATDPDGGSVSTSFDLLVRPVNDAPTLNAIPDQLIERGGPPRVVGLTGISPGAGEPGPAELSVASDNPQLFSSLLITRADSSSPSGTLTIVPTPGLTGAALVTVTVTEPAAPGASPLNFSRTFRVTVSPDVTAPVATFTPVAPDPRSSAVDAITFSFSEPVADFDLALTREGSSDLLTSSQTLSSPDGGRTWTLSNLGRLTFVAGAYDLTLSNARDFFGNTAASPVNESFTVTQTSLAGSAGPDTWTVHVTGGNLEIAASLSGATTFYSAPLGLLDTLSIDAGGGDDTLIVAGRVPIPLHFQGGAGIDLLSVLGTSAADVFTLAATAVMLAGHSVGFSQIESVRLEGGEGDDTITLAGETTFASPAVGLSLPVIPPPPVTRSISGGGGNDTLVLADGLYAFTTDLGAVAERLSVTNAVVSLGVSQSIPRLSINSGGRVSLAPGGSRLLRIARLDMAPDALLDLADNALVLDAPADQRAAALAALAQLVRSARNPAGPLWSGKGITSSTAAARPGTGLAALFNDRGDGSPLLNELGGQSLAADSILVKYAIDGDANLDGKVNISDYFFADTGRALRKTGWLSGDFDLSGAPADADDYMLIDRAFLQQGVPLAAGGPAPLAPPVAGDIPDKPTAAFDFDPDNNDLLD